MSFKGLFFYWFVWFWDIEGCGGYGGVLFLEARVLFVFVRVVLCGELILVFIYFVVGCSGYVDVLGVKLRLVSKVFCFFFLGF